MPGSFEFRSDFTTQNYLSQTRLTTGAGSGIDDPSQFSAQGGAFTFSRNATNIVPVALLAGQTLSLDVDLGAANGVDNIDTELWLVDARGHVVASNDTSAVDDGSTSANDPKLTFTAVTTGVYFIAVAQRGNDYVDGTFGFDDGGTDSGLFQLNVAIGGLIGLTTGSDAAESIDLTVAQRRFDALGGDDSIYGADTRNVIDGGDGDDYLSGNSKTDILSGGDGVDQIHGWGGNDTLLGGDDNDGLSGDDGADQLLGGSGSDYLQGGAGNDVIHGEGGDDSIDTGEGNDIVFGGKGSDYVYIDAGNDSYHGGAGKDTINVYNLTTALVINLAATGAQDMGVFGSDIYLSFENIYGTEGYGDTLRGNDEINSFDGNGGGDTMFGEGGRDYLDGDAGADRLHGGSGDDWIAGGLGNDILYGDNGGDSLEGGEGADVLNGGAGIDTYVYSREADSTPTAQDAILDFSHTAGEHISLGGLSDDLLDFRGSGPFQNTIGEVRVEDQGTYQKVLINLDSDSAAEMSIRVNTGTPLVEGDFYL